MLIKDFDIICVATDWDDPWGSKQRLMQILSETNRVLYVQHPQSFLHLLFYPLIRKKFFQPARRIINKNLIVCKPPSVLPFNYYFRFINKINQRILARFIKKQINDLGFKNIIFWAYFPTCADILGSFGERFVVYHCAADFVNEKSNPLRKRVIRRMENELVVKSDIILTPSASIYNKLRVLNANTYLFHSAVNFSLFSKASSAGISVEPEDMRNISHPRIGFVGYLDGKVTDLELLEYIALTHKEWNIVMVGPMFKNVSGLRRLNKFSNILFLGKKDERDLPHYINSFDVAIIPYVLNDFTRNVSPLKLYEYAAVGKPIVTSALPEVFEYAKYIKIASNKYEFGKAIKEALLDHDAAKKQGRINIAEQNSWESRVDMLSGLINELVAKGGRPVMTNSLSVIMPVFNEKNTIFKILDKVRAVNINKEIIIVDDCSTDGTREMLTELSRKNDPAIKVFFHDRNMGKGAAIRTGLKQVSGNIIIIQDADLELDPQDYYALVEPIASGKNEVVFGERKQNQLLYFGARELWFTVFGGIALWLIYAVTNILYRNSTPVTDPMSGYKVMTADIMKSLHLVSDGFEIETEITAKLLKKGYIIEQVPIHYYPRRYREGKKIGWRNFWPVIRILIHYRFKDKDENRA